MEAEWIAAPDAIAMVTGQGFYGFLESMSPERGEVPDQLLRWADNQSAITAARSEEPRP